MIRMRPATVEDIYAIAPRVRDFFKASDPDFLEGCVAGLKNGAACCLLNPDWSVGCIIGGVLLSKGVASVWSLTTDDLDLHPLGYVRIIKSIIGKAQRDFRLHRMEMTVRADLPKGIRFAQNLGFTAEGLLRKYGTDQSDHLIFGRVW